MKNIDELRKKANWVRYKAIEMAASARKGHIGGSLSSADILVTLYYGGILKFDIKHLNWSNRDRFILSKGHSCLTLYAILADLGAFPISEIKKFCKNGILGAHPDKNISGIEAETGSLGHGLGIASGMALAAKLDNKKYRVFVLLGDGECYEGSIWESAIFASHHNLSNLIAIVDRNMQCVTDFTEECNRLEPLAEKWRSFGWDVIIVDGHSIEELLKVFQRLENRNSSKPLIIIAKTIKGKGVSFMERKIRWHHSIPNDKELKQAQKELKQEG